MKFFEFKNITSNEADLFVYGEIVTERDDWFGSESDVVLSEFKEELDKLNDIKKLNLYINSPGGSVFAASTMVSMLERFKNNGHKIYAYVDGLSASAASFLMMVANKIKLYKNSMVMIHKPMSIAVGNANDLQKTIDALDKIEDSVMMPLYMNKSKVSEEEIKELVDAETWLSAKDMDKYFEVELLGVENKATACASDLYKNYKNIPDFIKNALNNEETVQNSEEIEENAQETDENEPINEENASNEQVQEENAPEIAENEAETEETGENETVEEENVQDNQSQIIKAKLDLIKSSLNIKKRKEER